MNYYFVVCCPGHSYHSSARYTVGQLDRGTPFVPLSGLYISNLETASEKIPPLHYRAIHDPQGTSKNPLRTIPYGTPRSLESAFYCSRLREADVHRMGSKNRIGRVGYRGALSRKHPHQAPSVATAIRFDGCRASLRGDFFE